MSLGATRRTGKYCGLVLVGLGVASSSCSEELGRQPDVVQSRASSIPFQTEHRLAELRQRLRPLVQAGIRAASNGSFERDGATIRAIVAAEGAPRALRPAYTRLPARANGFTEIEDEGSGIAVRFALTGASEAPFEAADGFAIYARAFAGFDVVQRAHAEGTEDYVLFDRAPAVPELSYEIDVSRVTGLRLVENTLEFIDSEGSPRLRVAPPYVLDSKGERHRADLGLEGCNYDTSPAAPWDRPPTAPGASSCRLRVAWADVSYPAVVDPSWVTTGQMIASRTSWHTATLLPGRVLITGGTGEGGVYHSSAELFEASPTGGTFAATGSMSQVRSEHTASLLPNNRVLITGGYWQDPTNTCHVAGECTTNTAEVYNFATGTFSATGEMGTATNGRRAAHTASVLGDGRVLVAGGRYYDSASSLRRYRSSAYVYDPTAGTFSNAIEMGTGQERSNHTASVLGDGRVLIAGGTNGSSVATALLFSPTSGAFSATDSLDSVRQGHAASLLADGRVLIAGGLSATSTTRVATTELYDPATATFAPGGSMVIPRSQHTATLLYSGKVLLAGGSTNPGGSITGAAELYDPVSGLSAATTAMTSRRGHTATRLASNKVLVTGSGSAQVYDLGGAGVVCTANDDCISGLCNGGRCCSGACADPCKRCSSTGECLAVTTADDADSCTGANTCDASGQCKLDVGQPCGSASSCASGFCADGVCCDKACGGACENCAAPTAGTCTTHTAGSAGTPACGAFVCDGSSSTCPSTCSADAGCAAAYYCAADNTCLPRKAQGAGCNLAAGADCEVINCRVCASGNCSDGFCCNTACGAACDVCSAALGAPESGTCGTAPAGIQTPACNGGQACNGVSSSCASGCATDADCGLSHYCSSNSTCLPRKGQGLICNNSAGQDCKVAGCRVCSSDHCVNGYCCASACGPCGSCSIPDSGTCTPTPAGQAPSPAGSCGLYVCDGAFAACPTSCGSDQDCISGYHCVTGKCVNKLPQGAGCSANSECSTNYCADGVCCDTACSGTCLACSAANKQSGTGNGTCGVAKLGSNPGNQCVPDPSNVCGSVAACKGTAAECGQAPPGTSCGATQCVNGNVSGQVCDGQGACEENTTTSCAPYKCQGNACTSPCGVDFDCASGNYCTNGTCVPQADSGRGCSAPNHCKSGFCVDGVCCDAPCNGQCEACDVAGNLGQCRTVEGAPHGARMACAGAGACRGSCDGTDPSVCSFVGSATACSPAACAGDTSQPAGYCDGTGLCTVPGTRNCLPHTCDPETGGCKAACVTDLDCALGAQCDTVSGRCAIIGASCKDPYTVELANGQEQSCSPYQCLGGACADACTADGDCAPGYQCMAPTCVATSGSGGSAGSGGSQAVGGSGDAGDDTGGSSTSAGGEMPGASGETVGTGGEAKTPAADGGCGCRLVEQRNSRGSSPLWALALALAALRHARRRRKDLRA